MNRFLRTEFVIGKDALDCLTGKRVAVFGVGGVGGNVVEALARSGVGTLDLIDNDTVDITNINRQLIATDATVGMYKTEATKQRVLEINPDIKVNLYTCFYLPSEKDKFDFTQYDYIVDAIDTVTAKIDIIMEANRLHIPIICAMGCGNRIDPTKLVYTDISKTKGDPLAKVMRRELRKRGIHKLKVVYSTEEPIKPVYPEGFLEEQAASGSKRRGIPGSTAFVPSCAGIMIASVVVRELIGMQV